MYTYEIRNTTFEDEFEFLRIYLPEALYDLTGDSDPKGDPQQKELASLQGRLDAILKVIQNRIYANQLADIKTISEVLPIFISIEELIEYLVNLILDTEAESGTDELANELGEDCFGMYLPMHAFYSNPKSRWGIYFFPRLLKGRIIWLYNKLQKSFPNQTLSDYIRVKVYGTFRHAVFNYQVERFATKLEILTHSPVYKPYNRYVKSKVSNTEACLEQALAESVVHGSRLISGRTELHRSFIKTVLKYCSDHKAPGYRDYQCKMFGGTHKAHLLFAQQIAKQQIDAWPLATSMATVKQEFIHNGLNVPMYIIN